MMGLMMVLGCGGSDDPWLPSGDPSEPIIPGGPVPTIGQLDYAPTSAAQGEAGGALAVHGSFAFFDEDGDVITVRTCTTPCGQGGEVCVETPVYSVAGMQSGTLNFAFQALTDCPAGAYAATVSVLDAQDHESNVLSAVVSIF